MQHHGRRRRRLERDLANAIALGQFYTPPTLEAAALQVWCTAMPTDGEVATVWPCILFAQARRRCAPSSCGPAGGWSAVGTTSVVAKSFASARSDASADYLLAADGHAFLERRDAFQWCCQCQWWFLSVVLPTGGCHDRRKDLVHISLHVSLTVFQCEILCFIGDYIVNI